MIGENGPDGPVVGGGGDVVPSVRAYDIGLVVKFDDRAGLEVYQPHPNHVPVAAYMREHK